MTIQPTIGDSYKIAFSYMDRTYDVTVLDIQQGNPDPLYKLNQTSRIDYDEDGNQYPRPDEIISVGAEFFDTSSGKQITKI